MCTQEGEENGWVDGVHPEMTGSPYLTQFRKVSTVWENNFGIFEQLVGMEITFISRKRTQINNISSGEFPVIMGGITVADILRQWKTPELKKYELMLNQTNNRYKSKAPV